ncbi:hypothetical protein BDV95DRAFT_557211 [Massariosphaeria phaeospora]|uniref:Uncharacterized protein n=1 Tax=Massariosphaeria phaeospora TaxID=100035 RepID=A0A7C8IIX4_9PLEO|nr:hypothetical protein BDV95DRAFT_557211 [Massariosphaeria phaeospora]
MNDRNRENQRFYNPTIRTGGLPGISETISANSPAQSHNELREPTVPNSLPPDIDAARRSRIQTDLTNVFHAKRPSHSTEPPSLKGMGTYTHVELQTLFPHQRHITTNKFLPLGGPNRARRRHAGVVAELPKDVQALYNEVREVIEKEEKLAEGGENYDPRDRFGGLAFPDIMVPPPPPPEDTGDVEMGGMGDGRGRWDMGLDRTNSAASGKEPQQARGTTYDASRDPRRRRQ